jgi:hypothetical protein
LDLINYMLRGRKEAKDAFEGIKSEDLGQLLSRPTKKQLKGTVSRDFRPLVFFINQSHLGH